MKLLEYYASQSLIKVIGIPKVAITPDDLEVRKHIAEMIQAYYPGRFEMHLLGASPYFASELAKVDFPDYIRSTDSALPYKLSRANLRMDIECRHISRWNGYFSERVPIDGELIVHNNQTFIRWAGRNES
jgi:hypothetical protein